MPGQSQQILYDKEIDAIVHSHVSDLNPIKRTWIKHTCEHVQAHRVHTGVATHATHTEPR